MPSPLKLPYARSYWVIPGKLMAGFYPGSAVEAEAAEKLRALRDCGVNHIINLMEEDEVDYQGHLFAPYQDFFQSACAEVGKEASFARFPIRDVSIPNRPTMKAILDNIDAAIEAGKTVYVHCWGGKGRTGTVIGCYLARHGIATGQAALDKINELRRDVRPLGHSPETDAQRQMVLDWQPGE